MGEPSPLSAMCARGSWFPDKRGMATGMAIMGFGGGAMIAAPVKQALLKHFFESPTCVPSQCSGGGVRLADACVYVLIFTCGARCKQVPWHGGRSELGYGARPAAG